MRYVDTAEKGGNMHPVGADAGITDTIPPALAAQPRPGCAGPELGAGPPQQAWQNLTKPEGRRQRT